MTAATAPAAPNTVIVTNATTVQQNEEPGVLINTRQFNRYLQRLGGCAPSGWADLWLALAGVSCGLAVTAIVTRLTLPPTAPAAQKTVLLMLTILGVICTVLCLGGYFTQREQRAKDINELKADLEMYMEP